MFPTDAGQVALMRRWRPSPCGSLSQFFPPPPLALFRTLVLTSTATLAGQMATATESAPRNHLAEGPEDPMGARTIPIITPTIQMSAPSPGEPMEITTPTNSSAPASATKSPDSDTNPNGLNERSMQPSPGDQMPPDNIIMPAPVAAAAAIHQPKIVQTAFIHKLYKCGTPSGPLGCCVLSMLTRVTVCWRTRRYSTLSHGRPHPRASLCNPLTSFRKC